MAHGVYKAFPARVKAFYVLEEEYKSMRLLLPREYLSGILVMSLGFVFNLAYWSYKYSIEKSGIYRELSMDPLATLPVLLSAPLFIIIGYYMIKERSLRAQVEESKGKLRETFSELQTILHTVPAGVITTDSSGLVNFFNRRAKEDLGLEDRELIATEVGELFREPEVGEKVKELLSSEPRGEQAVLEATLRSGRVVQVSMSQMPGNHRPEGVVIAFVDISMLKDMQKKLEDAYKELKEIEELKSNIIANVSHELRTPITIIKGFIEIAMEEKNEEDRINNLKSALRALYRLNNIVEDLIQVARAKRMPFKLQRRRIKIEDVVNRAVEKKKADAEEKEIKIEVDHGYTGEMIADPENLEHALLNLIDNAIKFNHPGGSVRVSTARRDGWVVLSVSDTGIGIPKEKLEEIFKPLTQIDPTPTRRYGGTGTGLAVVKSITDAHGGKLEVESEPGKGSTFRIVLPVAPPILW